MSSIAAAEKTVRNHTVPRQAGSNASAPHSASSAARYSIASTGNPRLITSCSHRTHSTAPTRAAASSQALLGLVVRHTHTQVRHAAHAELWGFAFPARRDVQRSQTLETDCYAHVEQNFGDSELTERVDDGQVQLARCFYCLQSGRVGGEPRALREREEGVTKADGVRPVIDLSARQERE